MLEDSTQTARSRKVRQGRVVSDATDKTVEIDLGSPSDLYDIVSKSFVARNVSGKTSFKLKADTAAVIVETPPNGIVTYQGNKMLINGVVVSYR